MRTGKILVTGIGIDDAALRPLAERGMEIHRIRHSLTETELAEALRGAVGYLHGGEEYASAEAIAGAADLRVISFLGVGYESYVDVEAAQRHGVEVTNTPRVYVREAVAEFTVGQIIHANRRMDVHSPLPKPGDFGCEMRSLRVGIVGLGAIGTRIAEMLSAAFSTELSYFSRTRKLEEEARIGITYRDLPELAEWCDTLVVMVPGNASTKCMINHRILSVMRPGAVLVNTARPSVVDPEALLTALEDARLSVAVFDGYYRDSPLAEVILDKYGGDRLWVTAHVAFQTRQAMNMMVEHSVLSLIRVLGAS